MTRSSNPQHQPERGWARQEAREAAALIERALLEDLPAGDLTTDSLFGDRLEASSGSAGRSGLGIVARCVARQAGCFCGSPIAEALFEKVDRGVEVSVRVPEGGMVSGGEVLLELSGPAAVILRVERVLLNFLQRLCGISSWTARWVAELDGLDAILLDTRKTTPGWRRLEKYAVRMGGGTNHRFDLSDAIMLKDNHSWILRKVGESSLGDWLATLRKGSPEAFLQVEVDSREEFIEALDVDAENRIDSILLDNFSTDELAWAVEERRSRAGCRLLLEASGGIDLENVRRIAETGVERISVGALTHSAPALDVSLELSEVFELEQGK